MRMGSRNELREQMAVVLNKGRLMAYIYIHTKKRQESSDSREWMDSKLPAAHPLGAQDGQLNRPGLKSGDSSSSAFLRIALEQHGFFWS